jgi:hypothetical protein
LQALNTRMITDRHFISAGMAVALKPEGRKAFYQAYEYDIGQSLANEEPLARVQFSAPLASQLADY